MHKFLLALALLSMTVHGKTTIWTSGSDHSNFTAMRPREPWRIAWMNSGLRKASKYPRRATTASSLSIGREKSTVTTSCKSTWLHSGFLSAAIAVLP